jgi:hypothetical protein
MGLQARSHGGDRRMFEEFALRQEDAGITVHPRNVKGVSCIHKTQLEFFRF